MPAGTSSEIPESKSSFCTLPLIYHPKGQNKAPYNSEMLENDIFTLETNIQNFKTTEFYFAGLALQYRTPEMRFPRCEIEEDNFRVSQGTQIRMKSEESFESKVLKQKQLCVAVAVAVVVS